MSAGNVESIKTELLSFDPENPRFYRLNDTSSVPQVIEEMLDEEGVQDLMSSIGQKGYFPGEPLLVVQDGESRRYVVIEGNRRLAAVKLLNGEISPPNRRKTSIKQILDESVVEPSFELPCIIYPQRRDILRYLGYRHITGIKEWDSLSKAKYLLELREQFYTGINGDNLLRSLAKDIGSRSDYVGTLLTSLSLYSRAESNKFYGLPLKASDIEFSFLTTSLNYSDICDWLNLDSRKDFEIKNLNEEHLKLAFSWLFVPNEEGITVLGESRNISKLAAIVACPNAVAVLKDKRNLSEAYLYTDGPESALRVALDQAFERTKTAWNMLLQTRPITTEHLAQADILFDSVRDIRNHIRDKVEE